MDRFSPAGSIVSAEPFLFHGWEDEEFAVVYVPASGDTHMIELLALELLRLIQADPSRTSEQLAASLAVLLETELSVSLHESVDAALQKLADVGLITCSPS